MIPNSDGITDFLYILDYLGVIQEFELRMSICDRGVYPNIWVLNLIDPVYKYNSCHLWLSNFTGDWDSVCIQYGIHTFLGRLHHNLKRELLHV
jgi:hypothetical protein